MHLGRPTTDEDRFSLKAAYRQLLKLNGGQEASEMVTRGKHQTLNRYGNPNEIDCQAPIDVILDLEIEAKNPVVTRLLARMTGHILIKESDIAADANLLLHLSATASESGQAIQAAAETVADGVGTEAGLARLEKEAREAKEAFAAMEIAARAKREALPKNVTKIRGSA